MHLFQGTALIIILKRFPSLYNAYKPSCFYFSPFSFFIYNKENSCIINVLGKYFQNDRFTVQNWFVYHYRWEVWRKAYFYEQSNKIYFCPTLSNYMMIYIFWHCPSKALRNKVWSSEHNMYFSGTHLMREALMDCWTPVCWEKELLHFVPKGMTSWLSTLKPRCPSGS